MLKVNTSKFSKRFPKLMLSRFVKLNTFSGKHFSIFGKYLNKYFYIPTMAFVKTDF
jgi:hypothetical protein